MPSIHIYADATDFRVILDWLNSCDELAFIVADGPRRWRATSAMPELHVGRACLWHIPSGPLPLLFALPSNDEGSISDPWAGWVELRPGAESNIPYFGAGCPGIIWLNVRPESRYSPGNIGLSSFEWIGNHYSSIGNGAKPTTEHFWRKLRRWIQNISKKIARHDSYGTADVCAFPSALLAILSGVSRDANP